MQHRVMTSCVFSLILVQLLMVLVSGARLDYPLPHFHGPRHPFPLQPPPLDIANFLTTDAITGIAYNPYAKHHPGRHVCSNQRNITQPVKTMQPYCKPVLKKISMNCGGNQICTGVRKEYQREYRPVTSNRNVKEVTYFCCPGWSRDTGRPHGCHKPICKNPCLNGGVCIKPNTCKCPKGFSGPQCGDNSDAAVCQLACKNGGRCVEPEVCSCPVGFRGRQCEMDVDECMDLKPCDHICRNTPGSYECDCKESFTLHTDGQSCHKDDFDGSTIEGKEFEFELLDKRLLKLETMMSESHKNEATKADIDDIHRDMEHITQDMKSIRNRIPDMEDYKRDLYTFKNRLFQIEQKASKIDELLQKYDRMKRCAFHNKICI